MAGSPTSCDRLSPPLAPPEQVLELAAARVCRDFGLDPAEVRMVRLGSGGGYSGARLWRVEGRGGCWCLRAWPPGTAVEDLHRIHQAQRAAGPLPFVPRLAPVPTTGQTWLHHAGRLWELATWMPGQADYRLQPSRQRLLSAVEALARLHAVWGAVPGLPRTPPAVLRRLERLQSWLAVPPERWARGLEQVEDEPLRQWCLRGLEALRRHAAPALASLAPWRERPLPMQTCLCDVWHDNILFVGEQVSGIVDYGGVRQDTPAGDLARMLGSLVGDDHDSQRAALEEYQRLRPLQPLEQAAVPVLDRTGVVVAVANWLRWLLLQERRWDQPGQVVARLSVLVSRIESWEQGGG